MSEPEEIMVDNQPSDQESTAGLRRLSEVWPDAAPELAAIFDQIPEFVGVPGVHLFWRLLANFPTLLRDVWPFISCDLASPELTAAARVLRQRAFIVEAVGLPSHKAFRGDLVRAEIDADFRGKIGNFNDLSQYALSRLLVVVAMLREASGGRTVTPEPADEAPRPPGIVAGAIYVPPLRAGEARGNAAELLQRVASEHRLPLLDDYYRSLARVSEYLGAAWNAIRPLAGDAEYAARAAELAGLATASVTCLPAVAGSREFTHMADDQRATFGQLLNFFVEHLLPQSLIDVTLIKALTEGPDSATSLPFESVR